MNLGSTHTSVRLLGVDGGGTTTVAWLAEPGGTTCSVVARRGHRMPKPSARKRPARHSIRRSAAAFDSAGLTPRQSMSSASDWPGSTGPTTVKSWLDGPTTPVGLAGCDGQRRRPCGRGRHTGGLGRGRDRGHRLDRGRPRT